MHFVWETLSAWNYTQELDAARTRITVHYVK